MDEMKQISIHHIILCENEYFFSFNRAQNNGLNGLNDPLG